MRVRNEQPDRTEVTHTDKRQQPWTVWFEGQVIAFYKEEQLARQKLKSHTAKTQLARQKLKSLTTKAKA